MQFGAGSVQINAGKFFPDFIYLIAKQKNDEFSAESSVFYRTIHGTIRVRIHGKMRFEGHQPPACQSLANCWASFCAVLRQPQA
jgi:hypothetical protein